MDVGVVGKKHSTGKLVGVRGAREVVTYVSASTWCFAMPIVSIMEVCAVVGFLSAAATISGVTIAASPPRTRGAADIVFLGTGCSEWVWVEGGGRRGGEGGWGGFAC